MSLASGISDASLIGFVAAEKIQQNRQIPARVEPGEGNTEDHGQPSDHGFKGSQK